MGVLLAANDEIRLVGKPDKRIGDATHLRRQVREIVELPLRHRIVQRVAQVVQQIDHRRELLLEVRLRLEELRLVPLVGGIGLEKPVQGMLADTILDFISADGPLLRRREQKRRNVKQIFSGVHDLHRQVRCLGNHPHHGLAGRIAGERPLLELTFDGREHAARTRPSALPAAYEPIQDARQVRERQLVAQILRRNGLEIVRLVQHKPSVPRQNAAPRRPRLREYKRVIDNDEMRFSRRLARLIDEALRIERTPPSAALLARTAQEVPRQSLVTVEIPIRRMLQPVNERRHERLLVGRHGPVPRGEELGNRPQAEIVAAAL